MSRRRRDLTDEELRYKPDLDERRLRMGGSMSDFGSGLGGMSAEPLVPRTANNPSTSESADGGQFEGMTGEPLIPRPDVNEDNLDDYNNNTGAFAPQGSDWFNSLSPALQGATARYNRERGLPFDTNPNDTNNFGTPSEDQIERPMGRETPRPTDWDNAPTDNLPTPAAGTTNPEPDNSHNPEQNNQEAHTTGMDMGQTADQTSGKGDSEDRPTYEGKANMKGEIMTKVIDALSDVMSRYLLEGNNRRHLRSAGWNIGNVIPQVVGGDAKTAMDRIGFANAFMGDPRAAVIGGAMSMLKQRLDKFGGSNVFEGESNLMDSRSQKLRDIKMFRGMDTYITKSLEGDSLVDKAKNYLVAEANHATTPNGNHRIKLKTDDLEEVKFISHSAVMPYIVLACVFYVAYHKRDLEIRNYHGMFKDYILKRALKKILKDVLGLDKNIAAYAVDILESVPQQLIDAFVRNIDNKQPLFDDEKQIINNFRDYIRKEYRLYFDGGYYDAVRKLQGQNIDLVGLMNGLGTARVLHLFATQIATGDNVVWEALNNQGLFLGLLELTAIHSRGTQDLGGGGTADDFLEQTYAMGIVRYNQTNTIPTKKPNKILNALKSVEREKTEDVAVIKRDGKDIIVVLKGSDFKNTKREKGDIVPPDYEANLENVAGSTDLYNTQRYTQSNKQIEKAIAEARKENGKVSVVGYSLGGRLGLSLASHYHSIPFYIYEPVIPKNDEMENVFSQLKNSNVKIYRVDNSSISQNLEHYKDKYKLKYKTIKQKRFSSHSIENFV